MNKLLLASAVASCFPLASGLSAQTYNTFPKGHLTTEGTSSHNYMLFAKKEMRWQSIDRSQVGSKPIVFNTVAWRRDGAAAATAAWTKRTLTGFQLILSNADYNVTQKADLSKNYKGTPTVAIASKTINLPDISAKPATSPAPWTNVLKLDRAYIYLAKDALLWEVRYTANTGMGSDYSFDFMSSTGGSGYSSNSGLVIGTSCTTSGLATPVTFSTTFYNHGTKFRIYRSVSNMPANSPVFVLLDAKNQNLTVPGLCTKLYAAPTILLTGGPVTSATGGSTHYFDNIPHVSGLATNKLYFQAFCVDLKQKGLPFSMSYGREITIPADPKPTQVTRYYHYKNATSTTTVTSGPWYGGIILRAGS